MATAQRRLRVAVPDEKKRAPAKPKTLKAAAESSERELLLTMRNKISDEIEGGVPPHTLAPLMRQLREIDKDIRLLDAKAKHESEDSAGDGGDESWTPTPR